MYCSTCGVAVAENLSYCNHCGNRIIASSTRDKVASSRDVKPELLVSAMAGTFILGLVAIALLLGVMKTALGLELGQILAFAALSFLIMICLEGAFLRLLFRRDRRAEERGRTELAPGQITKDLGAPQVQALREPLSSVTDQTTRAFEPSYTDRKKAVSSDLE